MLQEKSLMLIQLMNILDAARDDEEILSALGQAAESLRAAATDISDRKRQKMEEDIRRANATVEIAGIEDYCRSRGRGTSRHDALEVFRGCLPADIDLNLVTELLEDASFTEAVEVLRALSYQVLKAYRIATAEVEAKAHQDIEELIARGIETARSDADAAKDFFKSVLQLIREMQKRQAEAVTSIHT